MKGLENKIYKQGQWFHQSPSWHYLSYFWGEIKVYFATMSSNPSFDLQEVGRIKFLPGMAK